MLEQKVFHVSTNTFLTRLALMLGLLLVVLVLMTLMTPPPLVVGVLLAAFVIALVVYVYSAWVVVLVVSPEGVTLRGLGYTVASRWDNIERVGERFFSRNTGTAEGLILREPCLSRSGPFYAVYQSSRASREMLKTAATFIPVSALLGKEWRQSEFAKEVRRYAPHLKL